MDGEIPDTNSRHARLSLRRYNATTHYPHKMATETTADRMTILLSPA